MFAIARDHLGAVLDSQPWIRSLANILPLSALVDFINVPAVLHTYQLTRSIPSWCWPVTPSGSRFLLAQPSSGDACCLDRYGNGPPVPICMDGRFGDMYPMMNAETVRRCVQASAECIKVENTHENMLKDDKRVQKLELVQVKRRPQHKKLRAWWQYWCFSMLGWTLLLGFIILGIVLACWISLAFLLVVLATGLLVKISCTGESRVLSNVRGSEYNRLVITALHVNDTKWQVFYGEGTIVNALLNRPLLHRTRPSGSAARMVRTLLATCIFGQWALAIGAAATQNWNSFLVAAWILFCIFAESCLFTPVRSAQLWMQESAQIELQRYEVELGTRRALLNAIIALNPDTFEPNNEDVPEKDGIFRKDALAWINPILHATEVRQDWLEATRLVTAEAKGVRIDVPGNDDWRSQAEKEYWFPFLLEGVEVAQTLKAVAKLSGRMVGNAKVELHVESKSSH